MQIDLKGAREKSGLSQTDLAAILNMSQAQVSRYEQNPGSIPTELLLQWVEAVGTDIPTLLASFKRPPEPLNTGRPYKTLYRNLDLLEEYVKAADLRIDAEVIKDVPSKPATPKQVLEKIKRYRQKPNLVLVGRFDSGKSHLANNLLGGAFLPSQYQPATRVITFVRHVQDRPVWMDDQVVILSDEFWPRDEKGNQEFDLNLLDSDVRTGEYLVKMGSLEALKQHGVHDHFSENKIEGHSAIVYLDSPLLLSCNIVDFPGYSDKADQISEDVKKANSAAQIADVILYTAPATGFLNAEDLSRLSYLLRILPTPEAICSDFPVLGNLFIVATHAHTGILTEQLDSILETGSYRLFNHLKDTVIVSRSKTIGKEINDTDLKNRFFSFWSENERRTYLLKRNIVDLLSGYLPKAFYTSIDTEITSLKHTIPEAISKQIEAYFETVQDIEQRKIELQSLEEREPQRLSLIRDGRKWVLDQIHQKHQETKKSFEHIYQQKAHVAAVETLIINQYKDKKEATEYAANYLLETLQNDLELTIKNNSEDVRIEIDKFLDGYEDVFLKSPDLKFGKFSIPFDPRGSFLGGIAGLGAVGALAFWAAGLGNLGAYILVAQFVGFLASIGISVGGVAAAVSFVAAIGGPVTLAMGLVVAAIFAGSFFGKSWQRRLAEKISEHFKKEDVLGKYICAIDEYWHDTAKGFEHGADYVESDFKKYIEHLRFICSDNESSKQKIEAILKTLKELEYFFANIPWQFTSG